MASRYNAVHFDMDGVIADTEPFHVAAEQQTCRDYNFGIDPGQWSGFKGRRAEDIFSHLIQTYGDPSVHKPEDLITHKTDVLIDSLTGRLVAIEGVMDFLQWARSEHDAVSLVTSSNKRVQQFITETLGITELFDIIVTGDDISEGKPAPQPYLKALGRLGVGASESVVIEDSRSGILSSQAAGCDVLAITSSHSYAELATVSPTYIVESYPAARGALEINRG